MFDSIAPRYDLLNHVLSCNVDRLWWNRTARRFRKILAQPEASILDICCGTGDMTLALLRHRPQIAKADSCSRFFPRDAGPRSSKIPKSQRCRDRGRRASSSSWPITGSTSSPQHSASATLRITRRDCASFTACSNPAENSASLTSVNPAASLGKLYAFYFRRILPAIGARLSGLGSAYSYLPISVHGFPSPPEMIALMQKAGFTEVSWTPYSFGIAGLYRGVKL